MVSVSGSVHVDAPVAVVFDFLDDPRNHTEVTPSLAEVRNVEPLDNGGKRVEHTYTMAGVSLDGQLVEKRHEENERMVFGMSGGISGQITIETTGTNRGTELTYSATSELPGRVLSSVAAPFVRWYNGGATPPDDRERQDEAGDEHRAAGRYEHRGLIS